MKWSCGVLTTPRIVSMLDATLKSISVAGWSQAIVYSNQKPQGRPLEDWFSLLEILVATNPESILICEDDILMSANLRAYFERSWLPAGVLSLYTSASNHSPALGWHEVRAPKNCHGALAYVIGAKTARMIIDNRAQIAEMCPSATDRAIGYFCKEIGAKYMCHSPSFVRHLGSGVSTLPESYPETDRNCALWCEDASHL